MADIEKVLESLQDLSLKPIKFLEDKFNEFLNNSREKFKTHGQGIEEIRDKVDAACETIHVLKKENDHLKKQLKSSQDLFTDFADREWVSEVVREANDALRVFTQDLNENLIHYKSISQSNKDAHLKLFFMVDRLQKGVEELKESASSDRLALQSVRISLSDASKSEVKNRTDYDDKLKKFTSVADQRLSDHQQVIDRIDKAADLFDSRIKRDALNLSESLDQKFDRLAKDFVDELSKSQLQRKDILSRMSEFEHQTLKSMKSGKSVKSIDDFMKQVSYNAMQIAKIQQSLDEVR